MPGTRVALAFSRRRREVQHRVGQSGQPGPQFGVRAEGAQQSRDTGSGPGAAQNLTLQAADPGAEDARRQTARVTALPSASMP